MVRHTTNFPDGVKVELRIYTPWWSWGSLGLINHSINGKVKVYQNIRQSRPWYSSWFTEEFLKIQEVHRTDISINAIVCVSNKAGQWLIDTPTKTCSNVFVCTKTIYPTRFWRPPWAGGNRVEGVGFNVLVKRGLYSLSLQCHMGSKDSLPETHICK